MSEITQILFRIRSGEASASSDLLSLVYDELRRVAQSRLSALRPGQTLQATALVNEAYLKLAGEGEMDFANRAHFFGAAARAMRNILVDEARRKASAKRGGQMPRADLTASILPAEGARFDRCDLVALDTALKKLESENAERAQVVMLRYFSGLTVEQIAGVLEVSTSTVDRHWTVARAWLQREIVGAAP